MVANNQMARILEIIRMEQTKEGTLGALRIDKILFCDTLEPPWDMNEPFKSSIPTGQYNCFKINSPKFGETFEIMNVPGRNNVLIHAGNIVEDTEGCIIVGQYWGKLKGNRAVLNSGNTFREFMLQMHPSESARLSIIEYY